MPKKSTIPAQEITEEIESYQLFIRDSKVIVSLSTLTKKTLYNQNGEAYQKEVPDPRYPLRSVVIEGENYIALLSDKPKWSNKKPANMFSTDDLWVCVDAYRSGETLVAGKGV